MCSEVKMSNSREKGKGKGRKRKTPKDQPLVTGDGYFLSSTVSKLRNKSKPAEENIVETVKGEIIAAWYPGCSGR